MDSYEIIMTPDATADLMELRDYITDVTAMKDLYVPAIVTYGLQYKWD